MDMKSVERKKDTMEILRSGGEIECPFCKSGKIRMIIHAVFLCDKCGRGIVSRVKLDLDKYIQQGKQKREI